MNPVKHVLFVNSSKPPIIEVDTQAGAIYVRFSDKAVAKTFERCDQGPVITVDVDRNGEVVGIEGLCFEEFTLSGILRKANVRAENIDMGKARFRPTSSSPHRRLAEMAA